MTRIGLILVGSFVALSSLAACWNNQPPQTPEECKVTTDPEACRKAYRR